MASGQVKQVQTQGSSEKLPSHIMNAKASSQRRLWKLASNAAKERRGFVRTGAHAVCKARTDHYGSAYKSQVAQVPLLAHAIAEPKDDQCPEMTAALPLSGVELLIQKQRNIMERKVLYTT